MLFSKFFSRLYKKANDEFSLEEQNDRIIMNAMQDTMDRKNPADRFVAPSGPVVEPTTTHLNRKYPVGVPTKGVASDSLVGSLPPFTVEKPYPVTAINMGASKDYPEVNYLLKSMGGDPNDPKVKAVLSQYWRMREEERQKQYYAMTHSGIRGFDRLFGGASITKSRNLPLLLPHFSKPAFWQRGSAAYLGTRGDRPSFMNFTDVDNVGEHPLGGKQLGYASQPDASMISVVPRGKGESDESWLARALQHSTTTHELGHLLTFPTYTYSDADWVKWITPRLRSIGMQYHPRPTYDSNKGAYAFYTPDELARAFAVMKMGMAAQGRQLPEHLSDLWRAKPGDSKFLATDELGNKYVAFPELVAAQREFESLDKQFEQLDDQRYAAEAANDTARVNQLLAEKNDLHKRWLAARSRFWELKDRGVRMAQSNYPQLQGLPKSVDDGEDFTVRLSHILDKAREYEEGVRNGTIERNEHTEELLEMLDSVYRSASNNAPMQRNQTRVLDWAQPYVQPTAIG